MASSSSGSISSHITRPTVLAVVVRLTAVDLSELPRADPIVVFVPPYRRLQIAYDDPCRVVPEAVDYLCDRTRGRNITSERAGGVIAPVAERFKLPYTYGDRLRYSGQYVLLAAVALGRATVTKEGRSYVYLIKG